MSWPEVAADHLAGSALVADEHPFASAVIVVVLAVCIAAGGAGC